MMKIERIWAMPNKNTFSIKPIKKLIEEEKTQGFWIDPYANTNKIADITNLFPMMASIMILSVL